MNANKGFTLLELLLVVAIIAILTTAATPNFSESQVRAKVARARAEMATLANALEAYALDHNTYPINSTGLGFPGDLWALAAPHRYIPAIPNDAFVNEAAYLYYAPGRFREFGRDRWGQYVLASAGPNRLTDTSFLGTTLYDPSNGTISGGDIVRSQREGGTVTPKGAR